MAELTQAVTACDPGALDMAEQLLQQLDPEACPALVAARDCLDMFDFASAAAHIQAAQQELDQLE